jgi:peptidoglycan/xylan/chitin deacetylase (PgdA/CDA1 family)
MSVLKTLKTSFYQSKGLGLFPIVARSGWRSRRLLILGYHGISMQDEHESHPKNFLPLPTFEQRMAFLKDFGANVLDLGEGIRRLKTGSLPPRSVCITFDDGYADFYVNAYPVLRKYGFPATVYLTTYYCFYNRPIFRLALAYMMWKRRDHVIEDHPLQWMPPVLDLRTPENRLLLLQRCDQYAKTHELTGSQKDDLAAELASAIHFDYATLTRERLFHLMDPQEVAAVASGGIDIQLHTHRHRTPLDRNLFVREITENRQHVCELTGREDLTHFCYPSGALREDFLPWLKEAGVESAATCVSGLGIAGGNPLLLPRLLDKPELTEDEFGAWLTGLGALMPKLKPPSLDVAPE